MANAQPLPDPDEVIGQVEAARSEVRYIVTDFSLELVSDKYKDNAEHEGDIYVPEYQRKLQWNAEKQSYLIESLLLRLPIPPVFLYDVNGRLEIVDGSQRIRTMKAFLLDQFKLIGLEKLEIINGFRFSDLPPEVQRRLKNAPIRSFILDQTTDETTRVDLFRRLNTSGKKLEDAEIRKGAYRGRFLELIIKCAESPLFVSLTPGMSKGADPKSERQELVTRFFVYSREYLDFRHDVRKFLDGHLIALNKCATDRMLAEREVDFVQTMQFISDNFRTAFYRKRSQARVPRVRFEAVSVGTYLALQDKPNLQVPDDGWLWSEEFEALVRTDASNSGPKLRRRIEYVRDKLLNQ
jgi:hypothetical protein